MLRRMITEPAGRRRGAHAIKRMAARRLGFVSDQKFYLDSFMVAPRPDVERLSRYSEQIDVSYELPANGWRVTHSYPPRLVYRLHDATVDPVSNLVYDHRGEFVAESASAIPLRRFYDWPSPHLRVPKQGLAGEFAFFPSNPSMYHWFEDLAVFLHSVTVAPGATILVAGEAVNHDAGWYARREEVLDRFRHREIRFIDRPTRVESLILTAKTGGLGSPAALQTPHPQDLATIRSHFHDWLGGEKAGRSFYVSRRGFSRSPADEVELERIAMSEGYEVIQPAGLSMSDQAKLFSGAVRLAGLHGAALGNMVWQPEGGRVVEFFPSNRMPVTYACIAAIRSLAYLHDRYELSADDRMGTVFLARARRSLSSVET
jgi:hypothetical protein